jgi:hypothetical protein
VFDGRVSSVVKPRWTTVAGILLLVTNGCVEDRGFGADIATHIQLLRLRDVLECHHRALKEYPEALQELTNPKNPPTCPVREDVEDAIAYSQGPRKSWLDHSWEYRPTKPDDRGKYQHYELVVTDTRGSYRYRSFWLDSTGVVRSAGGRRANAGDRPEERQDASSP